MNQFFEDAITETLVDIVPENINRVWYMEYIFKYKFGNKLPRGKVFDKLRLLEKGRPPYWTLANNKENKG